MRIRARDEVKVPSGRESQMMLYDLEIGVEELNDGSDYRYIATSPDLPNLIVVGDTPEEVLTLVPQVAAALIASMKASGDALPGCRYCSTG